MICQKRTDTTHGSVAVGRLEMDKEHKGHRRRIENMKSCLDVTPPMPQPHLTLYGRDYNAKKRATTEAAFSDLKMIQAIARTMTRKQEIEERKGPVSLNADHRRHEIRRIMQENHRLLSSIEKVKPTMQVKHMLTKEEQRKRYIINSSHTARLSGEYESALMKIRTEDKHQRDAQLRSIQQRRDAHEKMRATAGTVSLPSLHTTGATAVEGDAALARSTVSSPGGMQRSASSGGARGGASSSQENRTKRKPSIDPDSAVASAGVKFAEEASPEEQSSDDPEKRHTRRSNTPHPSKLGAATGMLEAEDLESPKASTSADGSFGATAAVAAEGASGLSQEIDYPAIVKQEGVAQ